MLSHVKITKGFAKKNDYKVALCLDIYIQKSNFININLTIVKFCYLNYIKIEIILLCESVCKFELFSISYIKGTNL